MPEREIFNLIREIPLAFMAVMLFAVFYYIRDSNKRLDNIEKKMISQEAFDNLKEDVDNMKDEQVWGDKFEEFKEAIKDRLARLEKVFNGKVKG